MMKKTVRHFGTTLPVALLLLSGCAAPVKPLYGWGNYQGQVYDYFKASGNGTEAQIIALEESLQKNSAKNLPAPPGFHAHLGLLYANAGKDDMVIKEFEMEKALFPESSSYMDFLMRKVKK